MELCLLNLLILIDCVLCNSYPCVLFESLSHVINQESHVYSWNLGKIYLVHFLKFWNLLRFTREIPKFQKSELGKFIPNFPLKHVITSTNFILVSSGRAKRQGKDHYRQLYALVLHLSNIFGIYQFYRYCF